MTVLTNIENFKKAEQELKNHCLCYNYRFSKSGDLVIYLPLGYYYADYITIERKTKTAAAIEGVKKLEEIWKDSFF